MKNWIFLDSKLTVTIFCNPNMVTDIKEVNEHLDYVTNAGVFKTTTKSMIPGQKIAWFNPEAITNIFSYSEMAQKYRITYDLSIEDAFIVHLSDKQVRFTKTNQRLYAYKPLVKKTRNEIVLINMVDKTDLSLLINSMKKQKEQKSYITLLELHHQKISNK